MATFNDMFADWASNRADADAIVADMRREYGATREALTAALTRVEQLTAELAEAKKPAASAPVP